MPSNAPILGDLKKKLKRKYKKLDNWVHSDKFTQFIAKAIALFIIALMVLSIFVVIL